MIAIVDYGVGNLYSLQSSLRFLSLDSAVTDDPLTIRKADHILLPGVGAFGDAIARLRRSGLDEVLCWEAKAGKPLLGICLGMQLLYEESEEYGLHKGLGLVPGRIVSLAERLGKTPLKVPHMGWNSLSFQGESPLFRYSREGEYVYYVHSYYAEVAPETTAWSDYGQARVAGAVQKGNVFGAQFHPEKSGDAGLRMLKAFAEFQV